MGGKCLNAISTASIASQDVPATVEYISYLTCIPTADLTVLGSCGKVAISNDIDLAINSTLYSPQDIHEALTRKGIQGMPINKLNIASYAIPIQSSSEKGLMQVDFMFTEHVKWAEFAYFSAGQESAYKGAVRTLLLSGIVAAISIPGTTAMFYDGDVIVGRAGLTFDLARGIKRVYQIRPKKRNGKGYISKLKTINPESFHEHFPSSTNLELWNPINDPHEAVLLMFGDDVTPPDVGTTEQILQLIFERFDDNTRRLIFDITINRAGSLINSISFPAEIL